MPNDAGDTRYVSPIELARQWGCKPTTTTVRLFIEQGLLRAVNLARPGAKKPRWRIPPSAIAAFEGTRGAQPPAPNTPRRRRARGLIEFV